jgi:transcriptional regulator with XRE-family HTH domain
MSSDRELFGPRLRSERERRGISLDTIASVTKVSADLWDGLERNDFSRWPSGIFARAFVRDYARAIGLDGDEVVDEFCRLFPVGDRRASRLIQAQADLMGHSLAYAESGRVPPQGDRRTAAQQLVDDLSRRRAKFGPRSLGVAFDLICTISGAAGLSLLLGEGFYASFGIMSLLYYGVATLLLGVTPGMGVVEALRHRMPALFALQQQQMADGKG